MHPIGFQFKRAHLSTVALGRRIFEGTKPPDDPDFDGVLDMTPARFDILHLIHTDAPDTSPRTMPPTMAQITKWLGLSRATICVGIGRLVELGLVTKRGKAGRRGKRLFLTDEGLRRLKRAYYLIFKKGKLAHRFGKFFDHGEKPRKKGWRSRIDDAMGRAFDLLLHLGEHLGNRSDIVYLFRRGLYWNEYV